MKPTNRKGTRASAKGKGKGTRRTTVQPTKVEAKTTDRSAIKPRRPKPTPKPIVQPATPKPAEAKPKPKPMVRPDVTPTPRPGPKPALQPDTGPASFAARPEVLDSLRPEFLEKLPGYQTPQNDVERLTDSAPLTLLPVRLETVFTGTPNPTMLRLRIYPDQIHVDGHDPELSADEIAAGKEFWRLIEAAGKDESKRAAAQDWMAGLMSERRAAFAAELTRNGKTPKARSTEAKRPARAACLPKAWRVVGYRRMPDGSLTQGFARIGKEIPADLCMDVIGVDPYDTKAPAARNSAWLHDYGTAKRFGMGIDISLTGNNAWVRDEGIALLLVYGVSGPASQSQAQALNSLMAAHRFSDGLIFQAQGIPTNSVNDTRSGARPHPASPDGTLQTVLDDTGAATSPLENGQRTARVMGLGPVSPLNKVQGAKRDEDSPQAWMNTALWPVTWGAYFDELTSDDQGRARIPVGVRDYVRRAFLQDVRGAGPLPALRIGAQPYGILPVRAHAIPDKWINPEPWYELYLTKLRDEWLNATPNVAKLNPGGSRQGREEALEDVVRVLGGLPHPSRFLVRRLRDWRQESHDSGLIDLLALFGLFFLAGDDPTFGADSRSIIGQWGWGKALLGDTALGGDITGAGISPTLLRQIDSSSLQSTEAQIAALDNLRRRLTTEVPDATERASARAWVDYMKRQVLAHAERLEPLLGFMNLPLDIKGVLRVGSVDPKIAFHLYDGAPKELTQVLVAGAPGEDGGVPARPELYIRAAAGKAGSDTRGVGVDVVTKPLGVTRQGNIAPVQTPATSKFIPRGVAANIAAAQPPRAVAQPVVSDIGPAIGTKLPDRSDAAPLLKQLLETAAENVPNGQRNSFRAALNSLAELPVAELELRLRETLGLAGDRLDAWLTSIATRRLREVTTDNAKAQYGGYGFVLDLKPDGGEPEQQGYHLAPSIQQAVTSGILRSGWKAHGTDDVESPLSVNLTSDRLRIANELIEAVAADRMLGDVLGQRFERRLHDAGLDVYLYDLRGVVRDIAGEKDRRNAAIDGIALLDARETPELDAFLRGIRNSGDRSTIKTLINTLRDDFDALGDATLAEATHYASMGNAARAAAIMDAVSLGEAPPTELRHARTDIAKSELVHHVLMALPAKPADRRAVGRARTHPALDALAQSVLPELDGLEVSVIGQDGITAIGLHKMELSALDLIMEGARPGALGRRALALLALNGDTFGPKTEYRCGLDPQSRAKWEDFTEFCVSLAGHFGALRPMLPEDLGLPPDTGTHSDLSGAEAMLSYLEKHLRSLAAAALRAAKKGQHAKVLDALLQLSLHGLPEAVPDAGILFGNQDGALLAHTEAVQTVVRKRISRAQNAADETPREQAIAQAMKILCGGELAAELTLAKLLLPVGKKRGFDMPGQPEMMDWAAKYGHVRDDMRALNRAMDAIHLIRGKPPLPFELGQASTRRHKQWLGVSLPEGGTPGGASWVVVDGGGAVAMQTGEPVTGYVVDNWTERLPDKTATVAAHFQFDAPSSKAPQSILLAVTPDKDTPWTQALLERTLLETVENAQLRAVSLPDLGRFGHHFPAIFVKGGIAAGPQPPVEEDDGK